MWESELQCPYLLKHISAAGHMKMINNILYLRNSNSSNIYSKEFCRESNIPSRDSLWSGIQWQTMIASIYNFQYSKQADRQHMPGISLNKYFLVMCLN